MDAALKASQQRCLNAAAALAAAGKYDSALEMLRGVTLAELALPASVLRAKVHAQISEYDDAEREWQNALAVDPGNEGAQQGLRLTRRLRQAGPSRLLLRARLHYGVLVVLVVGLAGMLAYALAYAPGASDDAERMALRAQELHTMQQFADAIQTSIAAADRRNEQAAARLQAALEALAQTHAALASRVDAESTAVNGLSDRLDAAEANQAERAGHLAKQLTACSKRLGKLAALSDESDAAARTRGDAAAQAAAANANAVLNLQRDVKALFGKLEDRLAALQERVDAQAEENRETQRQLAGRLKASAVTRGALQDSFRSTRSDLDGLANALGHTARALSEDTANLKVGLGYVLTTLTPEGAQSYPARIEQLRKKARDLRSALQALGGTPQLDPLERWILADILRTTESRLRKLEEAYRREVIPWRQAMEAVSPPPDRHGTEG